MSKPLTIAIDGPASAGKGTVARALARTLGFGYVDTGAMYRAVALEVRRRGLTWSDEHEVAAVARELAFDFRWDGDILRVIVNGEDVTSAIREDVIGQGASEVSALPCVRRALLERQQDLGSRGAVVMDGRDIGTVVLPDAELKVYLDADVDERARRRHEELLRRGDVVGFQEVRAALEERDRRDRERAVAPLRPALDAHYLNTTDLTVRQAVDAVIALARQRDVARPPERASGRIDSPCAKD